LALAVAICVCAPVCAARQAAAAEIGSVGSVALDSGQEEFSITIDVRQPEAYAGAEFSLKCGEGVSVKSVKYSEAGASAGPVEARGLTWFSFFSDRNRYSGTVAAEVALGYSGSEDTYVSIENVSVYTIDGANVSTAEHSVKRLIAVARAAPDEAPEAGMDEAPEGVGGEAPDGVGGEAPPAGRPGGSEAGLGGGAGSGPAASGAQGAAGPEGTDGLDSLAGPAGTAGPDTRAIDEAGLPMAGAQDAGAAGGAGKFGMLLMGLLAASLAGNLALGYHIVRARRR
jgi:hypothetical protein